MFLAPKIKYKLIKNEENIGFSRAANQGINKSKTDIVLLLNPDTYLIDSSPNNTYKLIKENRDFAIAGGQIVYDRLKQVNFTATQKPTFFTMLFEFTILKKIFRNNLFSKNFWIEKSYKEKKKLMFSLYVAPIYF